MTSWLTSAIQSVRDKSTDALDFVRRDLTEFTTTVKTDTETYINKIKTQEVGDLGINRFVSKLSDTIKSDSDFHPSTSFDRVHSELTRLQNDESTYLIDPIPNEAYENWRETTEFNVDTRKGDIAQLLIDAPHVRAFYARLVPAHTTHSDFWSRYYYRLHQIEEEEARRTQLLRRANEICSEDNDNTGKNTENDWDEESGDEWTSEPTHIIQETVPIEPLIPLEHHEEEEQQNINLDKPNNERQESDTVSGDSWEREFDETDLISSTIPLKPDENPLTKSEQTITSESLTTSITTASEPKKKKENEFDDEWEAWS